MASEGLIGTAACAALYFLLVDPMHSRLTVARAEHDRLSGFASSHQSMPMLRSKFEASFDRLNEIKQNSTLAADELEVFALLMHQAEQVGARVDNLQQRAISNAAQEVESEDSTPVNDLRLGFSMNVIGTPDQIVALLESLTHQCGFTTIESLRLTPSGNAENPLLMAAIETAHWSFDTSEAARAFANVDIASGEQP